MGDRENPIKFGPEWLRNLALQRGTGNTGSLGNNNQTTGPGPSGGAGTASGTRRIGTSPESVAGSSTSSNGTVGVRVQLANLRYGREEMLALFEAASDPPPELSNNELLYQPRSKRPFALSAVLDDEMRERLRSNPHTGGIPSDRFGAIRGGVGRGLTPVPDNPRPRFRPTGSSTLIRPSGDNLEVGGVRPTLSQRGTRYQPSTEQRPNYVNYPNYANMFRSKRQTNSTTANTNWRSSQTRESGDEWRSSEPGRARTAQDKERDRERPSDRSQPGSSRRSMSDHNDESIPEWAFTNAEACGGTFDSSGAFHGYSNDDSNLPKNQDNGYSLSRSRTHNTLSRSKTAEEGSEEWWASEKAKKLSPKRFDAGDIKFKQGAGILERPLIAMTQNLKPHVVKEEQFEEPQKDSPQTSPENVTEEAAGFDDSYKNSRYKQQFSESEQFNSMMRQDINIDEAHSTPANDQRNYKSVMITPNNSLRQKHQNIGSAPNESAMMRPQTLMTMKSFPPHGPDTVSSTTQHSSIEDKIIDFLDITLESDEIGGTPLDNSGLAMSNSSMSQMKDRGMPIGLQNSNMQSQAMSMNNAQNLSTLGLSQGVANMSLNNPALNPHGMSPQLEFGAGLPMPGPGLMQSSGMSNHGMDGAGIQRGAGLPPFQSGPMPGIAGANASSLFLGKGGNVPGDIPMPGQGSMFPLHGLQHSSQGAFSASVYNTMMQQASQPPPPPPSTPLSEQWYYEDPEKNTQGPFSSRDMYTWYRAGFFTPSLMVRRACEREMRPLGSYGPVIPFIQYDVLPPYPRFESRNLQSALGLGVNSVSNNDQPIPMPPSAQNAMQNSLKNPLEGNMQAPSGPNNLQGAPQNSLRNALHRAPVQLIENAIINNIMPTNSGQNGVPPVFGNVGHNWNQHNPQQNVFDSLWGQGSQDVSWIENRVNNLPMYFWDQQPSSNSLLPEEIAKEMKTEDQILAQLRASQSLASQPSAQQGGESKPAAAAAGKQMDAFSSPMNAAYFDELQKIIHKDIMAPAASKEASIDLRDLQPPKLDKSSTPEQPMPEANIAKSQQNSKTDAKTNKQNKTESEKTVKNKENNSNKTKNKKKDEKKEELVENKGKDDDASKNEKRSLESSPVKSKKEEKNSKKDLEKEKKEWIKEGFTLVKGSEKGSTKDSKKKAEEAKLAEEAEKKRREEEKLAADEEKRRKQTDAAKKQQEPPQPKAEALMKKAPWSASLAAPPPGAEGPTLAEIQRLEREKKLEQIKEQQQMINIIAQQQACQIAREQEIAWAKKKNNAQPILRPSFAEIQAQEQVSRKQASVAAAPAPEEERPPLVNHAPWGNAPNGGGFWDTPAPQPPQIKAPEPKPQPEPVKVEAPKAPKKKAAAAITATAAAATTAAAPAKKVTTPAVEFEGWCTTTLKSWSSKIDVPTFIGFLKDIESPYEVKDYVRCYLGETKESGDFARQFLERRSKLLRVGMVTPSDDLCSPAMAVNPRTNSTSDYQEVKGKGKKTKKNKMLKVDARFLGFSATAAEDRINVGDIDTV